MQKLFVSALCLLGSLTSMSQDCKCPSGAPEGAEMIGTYNFPGGNALGVCGYSTVEAADTTYTKFALYRCGDDKIIEQWGVNISCKLERTKDALLIKEMYNLPVGQSFSNLWRPFYVHQFKFEGGKVSETEYYDKHLPKYTKAQIAEVIRQYNELPKEGSEQTMKVANMLFWATVSGSKETEGYLKTIPGKYAPFSEALNTEWTDVNGRYEQWKRNPNK